MLDQYQSEYLWITLEQIEEIEAKLTEIDGVFPSEDFNHVMRVVHSIKGTAGSYDFSLLGVICHNLEDFFVHISKKEISSEQVTNILKYIDLIKKYINSKKNHSDQVLDIEQELLDLKIDKTKTGRQKKVNHSTLVVDTTKLSLKLVSKELNDLGIQVSYAQSGHEALGRLLQEKFDSVIASQELALIKGTTLFEICNKIKSLNINVKKILLTSSDIKNENIDHIIEKGPKIAESIRKLYEQNILKSNEVSIDSVPDLKIHYIDDDKMIHRLVQVAFTSFKEKLNLSLFSNPFDGLKASIDLQPDLIILDVLMPEMGGIEVFQKLKEQAPSVNWKVIFITASESKEEIDKLMSLKPIGIITKPFRPKELVNQILEIYSKSNF